MRIALVQNTDHPEPCGGPPLASALAAAGHRVQLLTDIAEHAELTASQQGPGHLMVHPITTATGADELAALWAHEPPQVVHAIGSAAGAIAAGTGVPTVHAVPPGAPGSHAVTGVAARVLAASEDQHTALLGAGVARSRLRTVPAWVDTEACTPHGSSLSRSERPRLVVAGGLARGHGADAAVAALSRVPGAELFIAGGRADDDPDRARLFALAREVGVVGRVRFLGPVGDELMPRLLRSADVVVAAPEHDVSAAPVLAAMACGRPVVCTAVGGVGDAVLDQVTGRHVRPGRSSELAAALREVLEDNVAQLGYGIAGRDRACSRFDRARIADTLTTIYAELLDADAGAPSRGPDHPHDPDTAHEREDTRVPS